MTFDGFALWGLVMVIWFDVCWTSIWIDFLVTGEVVHQNIPNTRSKTASWDWLLQCQLEKWKKACHDPKSTGWLIRIQFSRKTGYSNSNPLPELNCRDLVTPLLTFAVQRTPARLPNMWSSLYADLCQCIGAGNQQRNLPISQQSSKSWQGSSSSLRRTSSGKSLM